jgi:hypothetical protein
MWHHQNGPTGRERDGLGQVRRSGGFLLRFGLADYSEVGIARLHDHLGVGIAVDGPPLRGEVLALDRLGEGG